MQQTRIADEGADRDRTAGAAVGSAESAARGVRRLGARDTALRSGGGR